MKDIKHEIPEDCYGCPFANEEGYTGKDCRIVYGKKRVPRCATPYWKGKE